MDSLTDAVTDQAGWRSCSLSLVKVYSLQVMLSSGYFPASRISMLGRTIGDSVGCPSSISKHTHNRGVSNSITPIHLEPWQWRPFQMQMDLEIPRNRDNGRHSRFRADFGASKNRRSGLGDLPTLSEPPKSEIVQPRLRDKGQNGSGDLTQRKSPHLDAVTILLPWITAFNRV